MARWYQDEYKRRQVINDIGLGAIVVSIVMGTCAVIGSCCGLPSPARSPTHTAYLEMTENRRIPYYEQECTPGYGVKKGTIIGAEVGAGICALVLGIAAASEIKNRKKG